MSSTYNHLRQKRGENKSGLGTLIQEEVGHQERLEATDINLQRGECHELYNPCFWQCSCKESRW
jgi:hypothetical protein